MLYRFTVELLDGFVGTLECPADDLAFVLAEDLDPAVVAAFPRASAAELVVVAAVDLAEGEPPTTRLVLARSLSGLYDRARLVLHGNLVEATQGETIRDEVLGSGDGTVAFQSFLLAQAPLASIASREGGAIVSTLQVRVNGTLWQQLASLADASPTDEVYVVDIDSRGVGRVTFGDGAHGARLPTGADNIVATYRIGAGPNGNVPAATLTVPPAEVAGISAVTNPVAASGGVGAAPRHQLRRRIQDSTRELGRIVSTDDYASFALGFGGIAKAQAMPTPPAPSDIASVPRVIVTIAGADGSAPAEESGLFTSLEAAMTAAAVPGSSFRLAAFEPRYFNLAADIVVDPRYQAALVVDEARRRLRLAYAFDRRDFAETVAASTLVAQLQGIAGIASVNLTALYDAAAPPALHPILVARPVRWEETELRPAQILMVNPDGVRLEAVQP